jgi:hypothetical protein
MGIWNKSGPDLYYLLLILAYYSSSSVNVSCSLRCALRGLNAHEELNEYLLFVNAHLMSSY